MLCKLPIGRYAARVVSIPVVQRSGGRLTEALRFNAGRFGQMIPAPLGRLKCYQRRWGFVSGVSTARASSWQPTPR